MYMHGGLHGATVETVLSIQKALLAKGFNPGKLDGIMGPNTKAAIVAFQKANGLVADGIVGPKTSAKLFTAAAPAPSVAVEIIKNAAPVATVFNPVTAVAKGVQTVTTAVTEAQAKKTVQAAATKEAASEGLKKLIDAATSVIGMNASTQDAPAPPYSPPTIFTPPGTLPTVPPSITPAGAQQDFLIPALLGVGALLVVMSMGK